MALTARQLTHLADGAIGAASQVANGMDRLDEVLNNAERLARETGTTLGDLFGTDPNAVVHNGRTAGQLADAVKALAQVRALASNLANTPVIGEAAATGYHLDKIVALK